MSEQWNSIVGYEGKYEVSSYGNVKSLKRKGVKKDRVLKQASTKPYGYKTVALCEGGFCRTKRVQRLLLEAFVGKCPKGMMACHIKPDTSNNRLDNLEWDTPKNNTADVIQRGTFHYIRGKKEINNAT